MSNRLYGDKPHRVPFSRDPVEIKEYAEKLIRNYGWSQAHKMATTEAAPHSPTGNLDGFWTLVLSEIEKHPA